MFYTPQFTCECDDRGVPLFFVAVTYHVDEDIILLSVTTQGDPAPPPKIKLGSSTQNVILDCFVYFWTEMS